MTNEELMIMDFANAAEMTSERMANAQKTRCVGLVALYWRYAALGYGPAAILKSTKKY